ncbi:hypothetical protein [Aeromicrobium sp. 179-A 4D2 NHS]|uniref:hypothetical protein n=1 Tax=Aeromicrobium sp. 179-A 4D2 NHS TaxID=3142375 RepID=UPI0039A17572
MPVTVTIVGALAAIISTVQFVPQTIQAWAKRGNFGALAGINVPTTFMVLVSSLMWTYYNVSIANVWGIVPNIIVVPGTALTLMLVAHAARLDRRYRIPEVMQASIAPYEGPMFEETARMPKIEAEVT